MKEPDSDTCQRCKLPIIGTRFFFRLEAAPPIPSASPVEVSICTACLESMQRWMGRRQRRGEMASIEAQSSEEPVRSDTRRNRRETKQKSRSRYDSQLNRAERWQQIRTAVMISAVVTTAATIFVLIAIEISTGASHLTISKPSGVIKNSPVPRAVDRLHPEDLE